MKSAHDHIVVKFINNLIYENVLETGEKLSSIGCDMLTSGGFSILDINSGVQYYSERFRNVLGFTGEADFPSIPLSLEMQLSEDELSDAMTNFLDNSEYKEGWSNHYKQKLRYAKKDGNHIVFCCENTIFLGNDTTPKYLLTTQQINTNQK